MNRIDKLVTALRIILSAFRLFLCDPRQFVARTKEGAQAPFRAWPSLSIAVTLLSILAWAYQAQFNEHIYDTMIKTAPKDIADLFTGTKGSLVEPDTPVLFEIDGITLIGMHWSFIPFSHGGFIEKIGKTDPETGRSELVRFPVNNFVAIFGDYPYNETIAKYGYFVLIISISFIYSFSIWIIFKIFRCDATVKEACRVSLIWISYSAVIISLLLTVTIIISAHIFRLTGWSMMISWMLTLVLFDTYLSINLLRGISEFYGVKKRWALACCFMSHIPCSAIGPIIIIPAAFVIALFGEVIGLLI